MRIWTYSSLVGDSRRKGLVVALRSFSPELVTQALPCGWSHQFHDWAPLVFSWLLGVCGHARTRWTYMYHSVVQPSPTTSGDICWCFTVWSDRHWM